LLMKTNTKKIVLLDAHAIIHRAYHALPGFSTKDGDPTGALFGVCTMLFKIIDDFNPDAIIACYDLPEKTFRHEAYAEYKGGRAKTDDELVFQLEQSRSIFHAFNIPIYDLPGFEADDMLGTIVEQTKDERGISIIIASGDMDTLQLVEGDRVRVYTLKKGIKDTIIYNEKAVIERYGFTPVLLPDYKALRGDPSDNIIGVPGIGDKTATDLVKNFGAVEHILSLAKDRPETLKEAGIKDRMIHLLATHEEEALFSEVLATIRRDAPIDFVIPDGHWKDGVNTKLVIELLDRFEFRSLVPRIKTLFSVEEEVALAPVIVDEEVFQKARICYWLLDSEKTNPKPEDILSFTKKSSIEDALIHLETLISKEGLDFVYNDIELPIVPIIKTMEETGISVDVSVLSGLSKTYHKELASIQEKIYTLSGGEFNINSPKQMSEVLFEKMGLPTKGIKKNATGGYSTQADQLEKLEEYPIIAEILRYREVQKVLSTYIDALPLSVRADGKIHAEFIQTGTTTGRFSSNNPNLQNIPSSLVLGREVRNAFVSRPGYSLVACDYSQIELRVAALLSQDEALLSIFSAGEDVHASVASRVFGVPVGEVTKEMRRRAKVINFGIIYGMGVLALKKSLGGTKEEAEQFLASYFKQFPRVKGYLDETKVSARETGFTKTLFGRKRFFPAIKSNVPFIRAMAERMAINAPIQGTATADIVKLAMKYTFNRIKKEGLLGDVLLLMQVHDELIFEVRDSLVDTVVPMLVSEMEKEIPKEFLGDKVCPPIVVDAQVGKSWGNMAPYKK